MITAEMQRPCGGEFIYASGSIAGLEGKKYRRASSQFVLLTYDADNT